MRVEWKIAWRYLFSKKGHSSINVVSGVSAAAVAVVTAAMVCVLSVMNGFAGLVEGMFSTFDPELKIVSTQGKSFTTDNDAIDALYHLDYVEAISQVIDEVALVQYYDSTAFRVIDHQLPVRVLGIDTVYRRVTRLDSIIVDGKDRIGDSYFEHAIVGRGLAQQLEVGVHYRNNWLRLYAPRRREAVNMTRQDLNFRDTTVLASGVFAVGQVKYDDQLMLIHLPLARRLFDYEPNRVSALCLRLSDYSSAHKKAIQETLGSDYRVLDRYEQQEDFFRIFEIEKWLTLLLLIFILMIAGFNVIGSLTMLILDKRDSIRTLHHLGARPSQIRRIFLIEGWLISIIGTVIGLAIGLVLCLIQQHVGVIKMGNGTDYIIATYPVIVQARDILLVGLVVFTLGWLAAWIPSRKIEPDTTDTP